MDNLTIPIVEMTASDDFNQGFIPSMNVEPLLHQVKHALNQLIQNKNTTIIDLNSLPLAPGEKQQIQDTLGKGEVVIHLEAMGNSTLYETNYSGVWWVEHFDHQDLNTGTYIEIASIPEIIPANGEDIRYGMERLTQTMTERSESHD